MEDTGDAGGRQPSDESVEGRRDSSTPAVLQGGHAPYQIHFQAPTPQQQRHEGALPNQLSSRNTSPHGLAQGQGRVASFNMGGLTGALPDVAPQQQQQHFPSGGLPSGPPYQTSQFAGQTTSNYQSNPSHPAYPLHYPPQQYPNLYQQGHPGSGTIHGYAPLFHAQQVPMGDPSHFQQQLASSNWVPQQQHQQQQYYYPMATFGSQGQAPLIHSRAGPYALPFSRRSSLPMGQSSIRRQDLESGAAGSSFFSQGGIPLHRNPSTGYGSGGPFIRSGSVPGASRQSSSDVITSSSMPRGPPRKPKQSGYALWVGNLPPGTNVVDLKDHFSKEATEDIESVFLISKSNCAFVNYRSEESCAAAMSRFHDSRFGGVRLVCRLRRSSASPVAGVPTGPASALTQVPHEISSPAAVKGEIRESSKSLEKEVTGTAEEMPEKTEIAKERFFVVKSLTVEDLELSVRNGIWATQTHNEGSLNAAFESAENVYLIFSANKSGEYFGYARMTSPINHDNKDFIEMTPKEVEPTPDDVDHPRAIATPATEFAPKGRIIDDSARGTIFWEADLAENRVTGARSTAGAEDTASVHSEPEGGEESEVPSQAWGKPFKIEWISTNRLPFYRTRGLRNPWNSNREVKIARDGTELETSVGRRLLQMFHRTMPSPTGAPGVHQPGYPQVRPS
ncbi:MAG: hypothetical protein M1812_004691 [Candelaria pacifica]|nr:MAG: hypothetical protein M1812_004691 [Candelaria pacifica]